MLPATLTPYTSNMLNKISLSGLALDPAIVNGPEHEVLIASSSSEGRAFAGSYRSINVLLCQPRVTVTSCFVYIVIRYLGSIDLLCINPIHRIGLMHK